jgi:hypothetical protein
VSRRPVAELTGVGEKVRVMTIEEGMSAPAIALALGVSERTVTRYRRRLGISLEAPREATPQEIEWMLAARAEGMPATWIAETVNLKRDAVQRRERMPEGARQEWLAAWSAIRRNPTLLALHREFASGQDELEMAA